MTSETFINEVLPMKHKMFRFANRLLNNIPEAEDVVQDVFIKLWDRRSKLKEYRSVEAFSMTITKNLCLDRLKSKRNKTDELTDNNAQTEKVTPHTTMEINDSYNKVNQLIDQLPEQQRMIVQLRDVEGYEFEEIASIMEISENTIRVNLSRARKKIRDGMQKKHNYEFTGN